MTTEKITITWDELNTRQVEQRLRQQDAINRNREYAQLTELPEATAPTRTSIWYNAVFHMAFFGLLGGLLAWTCAELLHFKPSTRIEAADLMTQVQEVNRAASAGKLTEAQTNFALSQIARAGRENPYFQVFTNPQLNQSLEEKLFASIQSRDTWKQFIGNVLAYGIAGLIIATCLSI